MLTISHTSFPVIYTNRLVLRQTTMDDINEIYYLRSHPELLKYIKKPPCASLDEAAAFIQRFDDIFEKNEGLPWAISLRDSPALIGCVSIWRYEKQHYRGEVGYLLHPAYQGQGIMSEALAAVIHYGFHTLGLHTLEANTDPGNVASHQLLEKHGFVREGHIRQNYYFDGKFYDTVTFGLISPLG
jgi:[ribosomal protein S5]-alanine N-acetyltransferase